MCFQNIFLCAQNLPISPCFSSFSVISDEVWRARQDETAVVGNEPLAFRVNSKWSKKISCQCAIEINIKITITTAQYGFPENKGCQPTDKINRSYISVILYVKGPS